MRSSAIVAAALPLAANALPATIEERTFGTFQGQNWWCLPYNVIVNQLLQDTQCVPFCGNYIDIASTTVTSVVTKNVNAAAVTVTKPVNVNGGGAVTITNVVTSTLPAVAAAAVTKVSTVTVTSPSGTVAATCLNSAYLAPTKGKRDLEAVETEPPSKRQNNWWSGSWGNANTNNANNWWSGSWGNNNNNNQNQNNNNNNWWGGNNNNNNWWGGNGDCSTSTTAKATAKVSSTSAQVRVAGTSTSAAAAAPTSVVRPSAIPWWAGDSIVSAICACAGIPAQTTTMTSTVTGAAATVTVAPTVTTNPGSTVTVVSTATVANAAAQSPASTVTSTTTTTVKSQATNITPNGLIYKKFTHSFDGYVNGSSFTADYFKGKTPDFTGVWGNLNFQTPYWPSMQVAWTLQLDQPAVFDVSQAALLFEGFFIAPQTGVYSFVVPSDGNDNFAELWTGSPAFAWTDATAAFKAIRTGSTAAGGAQQVTMNAGDAIPFTYLWANGGGAGRSNFAIVFPDNSQPTDFSSLFVQPCSAGIFSS